MQVSTFKIDGSILRTSDDLAPGDRVATLHRLPERRLLLGDNRGRSLGLTWHREAAVFVVSLWDGERCIGTVHLDPAQAGALNAALSNELAEFLTLAEPADPTAVPGAIGL